MLGKKKILDVQDSVFKLQSVYFRNSKNIPQV